MRGRVSPVLREARRIARQERFERRARLIAAGIIPGREGKYHNTRGTYRGMTFDSLGEAEYAAKLDVLVTAGELVDWEQPKPVVLVDAPKARERITYKPDFWVCPADSTYSYYVDYKGSRITETAVWKLKVKLWRQHVPHELRVAYADGTEKVV